MEIRPSCDDDRLPLARLYAAVAAEGRWIGGEAPVDVERRAESWVLDGDFVAVEDGELIGQVHVGVSRWGFGELGMMVAAGRRGRGVGSALLDAAIAWARAQGLHKLVLDVFPHNEAALALYRKYGFVEEGRRVRHVRRASGELWDVVEMALFL